uniref:Uncharacterized protein n=1 Tax=Amphiprion ocellaris TaxID=80972 RepID=A0A3Q1BJZ8_AMPOC
MGRVLLVSHEVDLEDNIALRDVFVKVFRRKWFNERREGPFEVVGSTGTAVQVKGSPTWYHLLHCVKAPREAVPHSQRLCSLSRRVSGPTWIKEPKASLEKGQTKKL